MRDYSTEYAILVVMLYKKYALFVFLCAVFLYTRLVGINWGLPYPMHPDERNMATAIESLTCLKGVSLEDCYNPHFFAYGQLPLYIGYAIAHAWGEIHFMSATLALRTISVASSVINLYFLVRIAHILLKKKQVDTLVTSIMMLMFTFVPYGIQFAHFGTTESLLMALYTGIVYYALQLLRADAPRRALLYASLLAGCAVATKVSSVLFLLVPIAAIIASKDKTKILSIGTFVIFAGIIAVLFSPHNIISYADFVSAMHYEVGIGQGNVIAFYNRQFDNTIPILFQITRSFPYALGMLYYIAALVAFAAMPYTKPYNLLRFALIAFFIPSAFLYAKWTRFIAPILPLMTLFAAIGMHYIATKVHSKAFWVFLLPFLMPGIAYISIYQNPDVRFVASQFIAEHIPAQASILSETANVVDIPLHYSPDLNIPSYRIRSFDFYHIDQDTHLAQELESLTQLTDYIFIPSRRIFANNTCFRFEDDIPVIKSTSTELLLQGFKTNTCAYLQDKYPLLNAYYEDLFSTQLGFEHVATISSFPRITLFGKTIYSINDENAEETWTVFDHPVIRIYKRR